MSYSIQYQRLPTFQFSIHLPGINVKSLTSMLRSIINIGSLFAAVYTQDPLVWQVFFLQLTFGIARFVIHFIEHRRKYAKLVLPLANL